MKRQIEGGLKNHPFAQEITMIGKKNSLPTNFQESLHLFNGINPTEINVQPTPRKEGEQSLPFYLNV